MSGCSHASMMKGLSGDQICEACGVLRRVEGERQRAILGVSGIGLTYPGSHQSQAKPTGKSGQTA